MCTQGQARVLFNVLAKVGFGQVPWPHRLASGRKVSKKDYSTT